MYTLNCKFMSMYGYIFKIHEHTCPLINLCMHKWISTECYQGVTSFAIVRRNHARSNNSMAFRVSMHACVYMDGYLPLYDSRQENAKRDKLSVQVSLQCDTIMALPIELESDRHIIIVIIYTLRENLLFM